MKKIMTAAVAALGLVATAPLAGAMDWKPAGPIKLIIAFAAGGGADTHGRLIAEELEASKGWKILPENVTGKGGLNTLKALKDMPNDGTTLGLVVTESLAYNIQAANNPGLSADDFTPITTTAGFQMGVIAKSDKGWKTFEDVTAAAKSGQEIRFGAMSPKLADLAYMLSKAQGIEMNTVMLRGGKAVLNAVNAGDVDVGWAAGIQNKGVKAGDLVNLASGLKAKLNVSPDAPTMKELGVDFTADGYFVFVAPKGMDAGARDAIASAIAEVANMDGGKANAFLNRAFGGPTLISGDALDALVADDNASAIGLLEASAE